MRLGALLLCLLLPTASAQEVPALTPGCLPADDEQTDLFCPGARGVPPADGDEAVACYKIPSLLRTARGTLLAFIEARKVQCGDGGAIDLRLRRSLDGGRTWLHSQLVHGEQGNVTIGDGCPVQDAATGVVHLIYTRNNADVYYSSSADEGATWSSPRNISAMVGGHREWGFIGTGHAAGLQLSSGRLIVPMHGPCHMIYSDDGGATWAKAGGGMTKGGECQVAEVRPGLLIVTGRNDDVGYTQLAYSIDDGLTWNASTPNADLPSPVAGLEASIVAHPNGRLYHSSPDSFLLRSRMAVKVSDDDGRTWATHRVVWPEGAGYSALAVLGNNRSSDLGLLYDRNNRSMLIFEARGITFVTLPA